MPVKTIAMKKLKGQKRSFYCDDGIHHCDIDFYPAELVEKIIEDLSNQVLDERKKWTSMFDHFKAKCKELRDARHAVVCEKDKEIRKLKRALYKACANWAMAESYSVLNDAPTANRWVHTLIKLEAKAEASNNEETHRPHNV